MADKYKIEKANFLKNEEFWCTRCDHNRVHSDKPETGTFYQQYGHVARFYPVPKRKRKDDMAKGHWEMEEYECVVFALCPECDPWKVSDV